MQIERSPFLKLDRQTVVGYFKSAGTRDPDVLHSQKSTLVTLGRFPKYAGIYVMVLGALLTVTILMSFLGIPALFLGWWMWRRGKRNLEAIEEGFAEFTGAAPIGAARTA
jgi:hypothetical protein